MRIQYHFGGSKDLFEKGGDFCLSFGRQAFGYWKVGPVAVEHKATVEKVKASVRMIFLFLLTLPISSLLSIAGMTLTHFSNSHKSKYLEAVFENHTYHDTSPMSSDQVPDERVTKKLTKWQRQYDKLVQRHQGNQHALQGALRSHRVSLYQETKRLCDEGHYYIGNIRVSFDEEAKQRMIANTELIHLQAPLPSIDEDERHQTEIEVVEEDTFDLGERYLHAGYRPVGLNMANAHTPGGGVEGGCGAQEESLFRRSNYFQALYPRRDTYYSIPNTSVVYTPEVQIFRTPETYLLQDPADRLPGYEFRQIGKLDMIACAFPDLRRREAEDNYEDDIRDRIRNILRVSYNKGHDALALGAIGCGAFNNDPRIVARIIKEELQSDEFRGRFKKIGFGVIYPEITYNQEQLNLIDIFRSELQTR